MAKAPRRASRDGRGHIGGREPHYSERGVNGRLHEILWPIQHGALFYSGMIVMPPLPVYQSDRISEERDRRPLPRSRREWQTSSSTCQSRIGRRMAATKTGSGYSSPALATEAQPGALRARVGRPSCAPSARTIRSARSPAMAELPTVRRVTGSTRGPRFRKLGSAELGRLVPASPEHRRPASPATSEKAMALRYLSGPARSRDDRYWTAAVCARACAPTARVFCRGPRAALPMGRRSCSPRAANSSRDRVTERRS